MRRHSSPTTARSIECCGMVFLSSIDTAKAIAVMQEKHEIACGMMHGFDWSKWHTGSSAEKFGLLPAAQEHILQQENGKNRFVQIVTELSQAFALCAGTDDAIEIR